MILISRCLLLVFAFVSFVAFTQDGTGKKLVDKKFIIKLPSRFIDKKNGTIIDNNTKLMWQQSPDSQARTRDQSLVYASKLRVGGYDDWRLPTRDEMYSLLLIQKGIKLCDWLNGQGFTNVREWYYWTNYQVQMPEGLQGCAYFMTDPNGAYIYYHSLAMGCNTLCVRTQTTGLYTYTVTIRTGTLQGAGTDAQVYLTLTGMRGASSELRLDGVGQIFENGKRDTFSFSLPDFGALTQVRIRHDNSKDRPGWFLEDIQVNKTHPQVVGDRVYFFKCSRWLAKDEDDRQIDRILPVTLR
jgi:hypothetical protein